MPKIFARHPLGYKIELDDVARDKIDAAVDWLVQHGYQPDLPGDGWRRTPDGEPICAKHNAVMNKREKQGDCWHSHRVIYPETAEELYCRGYPNPSSKTDGYYI